MTCHSFLRLILPVTALLFTSAIVHAAVAETSIVERSTSGRTIRLGGTGRLPIRPGEAVLLQSANGDRLAAARVVRMQGDAPIFYIVEEYVTNDFQAGQSLDVLYGVPLANIPELPPEIGYEGDVAANPGNEQLTPDNKEFRPKPTERLFTPDGRPVDEHAEEQVEPYKVPDVDDDRYHPEYPLRPKYPKRPDYSTHNLTLGVGIFRNRDVGDTASAAVTRDYTTRQGYALRYAYNFEADLWMFSRHSPSLLSFEVGMGTYNFVQTYSNGGQADVRVIPLSGSFRYMIRANRMFKIYPYAGYETNIVSATSATGNANTASLTPLKMGRLIGGGGAMLTTSESIDARFDAGVEGFLVGLVVKF
jgi:hypothetical protein